MIRIMDRGENTKPNNWRNNFKEPTNIFLFGICRHKKWFFLNYSCHLSILYGLKIDFVLKKDLMFFSRKMCVCVCFFSGWFCHLLFLKTDIQNKKTKRSPFLFPEKRPKSPSERRKSPSSDKAMVRRAFESHVAPYLKPPNCCFSASGPDVWLNPRMNQGIYPEN